MHSTCCDLGLGFVFRDSRFAKVPANKDVVEKPDFSCDTERWGRVYQAYDVIRAISEDNWDQEFKAQRDRWLERDLFAKPQDPDYEMARVILRKYRDAEQTFVAPSRAALLEDLQHLCQCCLAYMWWAAEVADLGPQTPKTQTQSCCPIRMPQRTVRDSPPNTASTQSPKCKVFRNAEQITKSVADSSKPQVRNTSQMQLRTRMPKRKNTENAARRPLRSRASNPRVGAALWQTWTSASPSTSCR